MKFRFAVIIVVVLLLAACGGARPDFEDRISGEDGEYAGIVMPLEKIDIYQGGTHFLSRENGRDILLQSADVNLSRYTEKAVTVFGRMQDPIGNAEPVFNVVRVQLNQTVTGEGKVYENTDEGFSFRYPEIWEIEASGDSVTLFDEGKPLIRVDIESTGASLETFIKQREDGDGESVTVGEKPAFRFTEGAEMRFYLANPAREKIYRLQFQPDEGEKMEEQKTLFLEWIKSFTPLFSGRPTGERCAGPAKLKCDEGYRCDLFSTQKDAAGVCVPLDAQGDDRACPFIPKPSGCLNAEAAEFSAAGCPTRYRCADGTPAEASPQPVSAGRVIDTIEKYKNSLLKTRGAAVTQYQVTPDESLIAVIYGDEKTLFSYAPSGNEFEFIERAYFKKIENRWELVSGADLQAGKEVQNIFTGD